MIFWALENADDATMLFFGGVMALAIVFMLTMALIECFKNLFKKRK